MGIRCQAVKAPSSAVSSSFLHKVMDTEEIWALNCPATVSGNALLSTTHWGVTILGNLLSLKGDLAPDLWRRISPAASWGQETQLSYSACEVCEEVAGRPPRGGLLRRKQGLERGGSEACYAS